MVSAEAEVVLFSDIFCSPTKNTVWIHIHYTVFLTSQIMCKFEVQTNMQSNLTFVDECCQMREM